MNSKISGIEYQQGTLHGYEVKEYLLEKWNYKCAYCGMGEIPLQIDHIIPKSKSGSNRICNLCLACEKCNQKKNNDLIDDFLKNKPDLLNKIKSQCKRALKDAAAVNITRNELLKRLKETGLPVETGSGGLTKFNRTGLNLPKKHWIDAACVGESTPNKLSIKEVRPLLIKTYGHGQRQMCRPNKYGFPICHKSRNKVKFSFQTGDICMGVGIRGRNKGVKHSGRILIRTSGQVIMSKNSFLYKNVLMLQMSDGFDY
jgi:hypothetical protein